jgi:hypothetical protein
MSLALTLSFGLKKLKIKHSKYNINKHLNYIMIKKNLTLCYFMKIILIQLLH